MLSQSVKGPFTGDIDSPDMLHDIMKYIPYNRRTLTSMRCVSKPFRSAVQSPHSPWAGNSEVMLSRYGQCVLFNAMEDDEGRSNFSLFSISPIGRKFRNQSARLLVRYHALVANGLTKLALHHSHVDNNIFDFLGALTHLRDLELVACRSITAVGEAKRVKDLEVLEVAFCPLEEDGVQGLHLPKLKKLTIRSCHNFSNLNGISLDTAASLEDVSVENCNIIDDTCNVFFGGFTKNLHSMCLSSTHIDRALVSVPELARSQGLRVLHLVDTPLRVETLQEICPSMSARLENLSLEGCLLLEGYEPLGQLRALKFLDVSRAEIGDGLETLVHCAKLELFRMADSQIEGIEYLSNLKNLRVLDAASSSLTDYALMALEGSPMLDTVILTNCLYISNVNVLATCPNMRRIFCGKTEVSDEGIAELVSCEKLELLDLKLNSNLVNVNFLAECPSLKTINLCSTVGSQDALVHLLEKQSRTCGLQVLCDTFEGDDFTDG